MDVLSAFPSARAVWHRLDCEGSETARLDATSDGFRLSGAASFQFEGNVALLRYEVECDQAWRTRGAWVEGVINRRAVAHTIKVLANGSWLLDGREQPALQGCVDVDLNFSPITNTLPIRRLSLAIGDSAAVNAAWLRFPSFALEKLDQVYRRAGTHAYHYESGSGQFHADVTVDANGLVRDYPPLWTRAESAGP